MFDDKTKEYRAQATINDAVQATHAQPQVELQRETQPPSFGAGIGKSSLAKAFFESSKSDRGITVKVENDTEVVHKFYDQDGELKMFIIDPKVGDEEKEDQKASEWNKIL